METGQQATFTGIEESTAEDWAIIGKSFVAHGKGLADRILAHLELLDGDFGGLPLEHFEPMVRRLFEVPRQTLYTGILAAGETPAHS